MRKRESNIELLRIVAMLMVLFLHSNMLCLGFVDRITSIESFVSVLAEQLCVICVNLFVLITGWFGLKPKLKGAFSLLFQVSFYGSLIFILFALIGYGVDVKGLLNIIYFGSTYWFVTAYLILYCLSPVFNIFVKYSPAKLFVTVLLFYFLLEFSLGWFRGNIAPYNKGYSTISFIGLYLLGRFLALHYSLVKMNFNIQKCIFLYFLCTIIPILYFYFTGHDRNMLFYSSPFVVFASMFFFLSFTQLKFYNKYVNYMACSSFSIYLIHIHPSIWPLYESIMRSAYANMHGFMYVIFVVIFSVVFGVCCMLVDKLRIKIWDIFCNIFIDKLIVNIDNLFSRLCERVGL